MKQIKLFIMSAMIAASVFLGINSASAYVAHTKAGTIYRPVAPVARGAVVVHRHNALTTARVAGRPAAVVHRNSVYYGHATGRRMHSH